MNKGIAIVTLIAILLLSACGRPNEIPVPIDEKDVHISDNITEEAQYIRLFPNDGKMLCVFEQKEGNSQGKDVSDNYSAILLFDYAEKEYQRIELNGYTVHEGITPSAPVLFGDNAIVVEPGAFHCDAYTILAEDIGRVFIVNSVANDVRILDPESSWHLLGSPVFRAENDPENLYITGCSDTAGEVVLLRIDMRTGSVESLGEYRDTELKAPRNQLPFSMKWHQPNGYTYGYRGDDTQNQVLFGKATQSKGDYELLIEDCYPEDYGMTLSGGFCVLDDRVYFYGVRASDHSDSAIFCYDLNKKMIESKKPMDDKGLLPVDRFGEYLILASPEQIRGGVPFPVDGVRYIDEQKYMSGEEEAIPFSEKP